MLLLRRRDADPRFDGGWHLPAGKVEVGESVVDAAVREVGEEVGIAVEVSELELVHVVHAAGEGLEARVGLFFVARQWAGEPVNREPEKCSGVEWFAVDWLPDGVIAYPAAGIRGYLGGQSFSLVGWEAREPGAGPGHSSGR